MSISIVNGYVCTSSCDVAKAKKGQDPHPAEGQDPGKDPNKTGSGGQVGAARDDAVVLSGALAKPANPDAVQPVAAAQASAPTAAAGKKLVDFLV